MEHLGTNQQPHGSKTTFSTVLKSLCWFFLLALAGATPAAEFIVTSTSTNLDTSDVSPGNTVCADSFGRCSLRAAIEESNALVGPDTITLPQVWTVYSVTAGDLVVSSDITINGSSTDGNSILRGTAGDRVFRITSSGTLTMSNVVVEDGGVSTDGGNILVYGEATLSNCTVQDGVASENGGGIAVKGGTLTLVDCTISNNQAGHQGGGIHADSSTKGSATVSILQDSQIIGNTVTGADPGDGGGGLYTTSGTVSIAHGSISSNHADDAAGGGLLASGGSTISVTFTTVDGNSAMDGGGVFTEVGGDVLASGSAFTNNVASRHGGGLYVAGGNDSALVNSTISGNTADANGGGVYASGAGNDLHLSNVTVANNTADLDGDNDGSGGGVYNDGAPVELRNTIVADNQDACSQSFPPCAWAPDCDGELTSDGYNIIGLDGLLCTISGDTTGNQVSYSTPLETGLGPLTDESTYETEFHPLQLHSPAWDRGNPAGCVDHDGAPVAIDQRGENRPAGIRCDIGAVESQSTQDLVIFTDGFESGNDNGWSRVPTQLYVTSDAAHRGHWGLETGLDAAPAFVEDNSPGSEPRYRARFCLDPDGITVAQGAGFDLLTAFSGTTAQQIRLRISQQAGDLVLSAEVRDNGAPVAGADTTLTNGWQTIEIDWKQATSSSASDGHLRLWHEGSLTVDIDSVDNDGETIDQVRLGAVGNVVGAISGNLLLDDFASTRSGLISSPGDVNRNGSNSTDDMAALLEALYVPGPNHPSLDVNGDHALDAADCAEQLIVLSE